MEIRGIHAGRVENANAHHTTSSVSKQPNSAPNAGGDLGANSLSRSPQLLRLTEVLRRIPEVREEVVARVSEKLAAGDYDTRGVAEQTAERILNHR